MAEQTWAYVDVRDFDMPFWSLVGFMIKFAFASIPAMIVMAAVGLGLFIVGAGIVAALGVGAAAM